MLVNIDALEARGADRAVRVLARAGSLKVDEEGDQTVLTLAFDQLTGRPLTRRNLGWTVISTSTADLAHAVRHWRRPNLVAWLAGELVRDLRHAARNVDHDTYTEAVKLVMDEHWPLLEQAAHRHAVRVLRGGDGDG